MEPAPRRAPVPRRDDRRDGACREQPLDARLHARPRALPLSARQDDHGAAALQAPARGRRLGHHGRDGAAVARLPDFRREAPADGESAPRASRPA